MINNLLTVQTSQQESIYKLRDLKLDFLGIVAQDDLYFIQDIDSLAVKVIFKFMYSLKISVLLFCFVGTYHHGSLSNLLRYCFFSYLDKVDLRLNAFPGA